MPLQSKILTDGAGGPVAVKPAGGAAAPSDQALVVALSPNSPLPAPTSASTSTGGAQTALSAGVSTVLFAASTTRLGGAIFSDTQIVNINLGAAATATAFTDQVSPGGSWYFPESARGLSVGAFCASACNVYVTSW